MIKLYKGKKPDILEKNSDRWTKEYLKYKNLGIGNENIKTKYNHPEIKSALLNETHEKCAYCESKFLHVSPGDIEHIIPKSKRPELYVKWENLTISCEQCNRSGKKNYYDIDLPLINPYLDNPEEHFYECGSLIFPKLNDNRAEITINVIKLNRASLVERRKERIESVDKLLRSWAKEEREYMKEELHRQLIEECREDKEYSSTIKAFLIASKFPM